MPFFFFFAAAKRTNNQAHIGWMLWDVPLYRIVSKFKPTRFGSRKSFRWESHVPSPTYIVLEE